MKQGTQTITLTPKQLEKQLPWLHKIRDELDLLYAHSKRDSKLTNIVKKYGVNGEIQVRMVQTSRPILVMDMLAGIDVEDDEAVRRVLTWRAEPDPAKGVLNVTLPTIFYTSKKALEIFNNDPKLFAAYCARLVAYVHCELHRKHLRGLATLVNAATMTAGIPLLSLPMVGPLAWPLWLIISLILGYVASFRVITDPCTIDLLRSASPDLAKRAADAEEAAYWLKHTDHGLGHTILKIIEEIYKRMVSLVSKSQSKGAFADLLRGKFFKLQDLLQPAKLLDKVAYAIYKLVFSRI